jgi:hypothetical protein
MEYKLLPKDYNKLIDTILEEYINSSMDTTRKLYIILNMIKKIL